MRLTTAKEIVAVLNDASELEIPTLCNRYQDDPRVQVQKAVSRAQKRLSRITAEKNRVAALYDFQREVGGSGIIIGVDEVGRGAVAGPLTVGAVALPDTPQILGLNDSKQLTPSRRETLAVQIQQVAYAYGIAHIEPRVIDEIGMAASLRQAMAEAISQCGLEPDCVLIDGNPIHAHPKEQCVVKGDARIAAIAAASIIAKVTRDALMVSYDSEYPEYHFTASKGYASAEHIAAIKTYGLSPLHRVSFCGNFLETPRLF